jgi:hypothetical protein
MWPDINGTSGTSGSISLKPRLTPITEQLQQTLMGQPETAASDMPPHKKIEYVIFDMDGTIQ